MVFCGSSAKAEMTNKKRIGHATFSVCRACLSIRIFNYLNLKQATPKCNRHRMCPIVSAQLGDNILNMKVDRRLRNHKLIGNWPLTLLSVLIGLVFVVAVGLFMGSLFQNTMQVNTWASLVLMVLLAPSFPMPGLSATLETASRLIPTYYFVEALKLSLAGTASVQLWKHLVVVLGFTLVALFAATWGLRRQQN